MQHQEQPSSSAGSSRYVHSETLLKIYENSQWEALPQEVIQELEVDNFSCVDISGAMKLVNINTLPEACLKKTFEQSRELEIEPFSNERSQEFLEILNRIHHEMVSDEFMHQMDGIAEENFTDFLPSYFKAQYTSLVEKCRQEINHPVFSDSTNMDLLDTHSHNEIVNSVIDEAVDLNNECLAYKMRWQIINNIQNIRFHRENVLKIPVDYPFGLPVYLY